MWNLKGCPRCGGDIIAERYHGILHKMCLQCGYWKEVRIIAGVQQQTEIKKEVVKNA